MKITHKKYPNLNLANEDDRGENLIIDFVISSFLGVLVAYLTFKNFTNSVLIYIAVRFVYYFIFELAYGRTPDKYQTQTIVVNKVGDKPSIFQLVTRTLSRFISTFSGVTDDERTIHDNISNTFVIKDIALKKINIRQPLILIFNLSVFGGSAFYIKLSNQTEWDALSILAIVLLAVSFIGSLIYGIKKIKSST